MQEHTRRLFVGIDWGTETHHVCIVNSDAHIVENRKVSHSAGGLAEFLRWLSAYARIRQPQSSLRSKYRMAPLSRCYLNMDSKYSLSIRNSLTASVTAIFRRVPRMMAEMLLCSPIRYVRTNIAFERCASSRCCSNKSTRSTTCHRRWRSMRSRACPKGAKTVASRRKAPRRRLLPRVFAPEVFAQPGLRRLPGSWPE